MASAPAVEAPPGVKIDVIALAKFELATGRLVTADSAFVAIADLRDVDLDLQLTWRGIFAGHGMIFRHQDTRRVVDLSISLIADILKRFTVDASMRFIHRDVLIVTRIGRLKVQIIFLWNISLPSRLRAAFSLLSMIPFYLVSHFVLPSLRPAG